MMKSKLSKIKERASKYLPYITLLSFTFLVLEGALLAKCILEQQQVKTKVYIIPTYSIYYNITDYIRPTIYKLNMTPPFVLIFYRASNPLFDINETVDFISNYNATVLLYNLERPWFGLQLTKNVTLALIPLLPLPSVLCVDKNYTVHAILGRQVTDKETLLTILHKCLNK